MRTINMVCVIASFVLFFSANLFSQKSGDFQTATTGQWNAIATWHTYNGSAWVSATSAPTGSENITIQATDSIDVNVPVTITGYLKSLSGRIGNSAANLTFGNNGTYEHAVNGGNAPVATWGTGSTYLITGVTANAPSNSSQNFYNVTWNCPNYGGSAVNLGWNKTTIGGNLTVYGAPTRTGLRLTASAIGNAIPGGNVLTINGDVILADYNAYLTATGSSGIDTIAVYVKGNITSHGDFRLANGSGCMSNWYVSGNVNILGGDMTTNSNTTSLPDSFIFNGTSKQTFYKADSVGSISNVMFALRPGAIVDLSTTSIGGSLTTFTQPSGTTLLTSHPRGLKGNLSMQGSIKLPVNGNYEYNALVAQVDSLLPSTVNNLTINNPTTVSFVKADTINGVLTLKQGTLDNSVNAITIGTGGSVVFAGGKTTVPIPGWTSVKDVSVAPREFKLYNNYPNPFNPSTQIRFSVPKDGFTSLRVMNILGQEVATLFEGYAKAGNFLEVMFDARNLSSGIYFARLQQEGKISIQKMNLIK